MPGKGSTERKMRMGILRQTPSFILMYSYAYFRAIVMRYSGESSHGTFCGTPRKTPAGTGDLIIKSCCTSTGSPSTIIISNQSLTHNLARTEALCRSREKARIGVHGLEAYGTFCGTISAYFGYRLRSRTGIALIQRSEEVDCRHRRDANEALEVYTLLDFTSSKIQFHSVASIIELVMRSLRK